MKSIMEDGIVIRIGKPFIIENGDRAELHAHVTISGDTASCFMEETGRLPNTSWLNTYDYPPASWDEEGSSLWFAVPLEYGKYLCAERSDAFVIAFLWYAMVTGADISFEAPMSEKLHDGLTQKLIPALAKDGYRAIKLEGPLSDEPVWNEGGVLTGMSCGADAMYTLHTYGGEDAPEGMRLTHLAYYHAAFMFPFIEPPYDVDAIIAETERMYELPTAEHARSIAAHHGLGFVEVWTNLDRDYYRGGLIYSGMYRFLSCTLALEHLCSLYIISSSGHGHDLNQASLFATTQSYEDLICGSCGTETLRYLNSDHETRTQKLKAIADDPDFQKYAAVCFNDTEDGRGCGECSGCWKTMVPLDILGKLDRFGARFDLDRYYRERRSVFRDFISFSFRPEAAAVRESVRQILDLAEETGGEAGEEFAKAWQEIKEKKEKEDGRYNK